MKPLTEAAIDELQSHAERIIDAAQDMRDALDDADTTHGIDELRGMAAEALTEIQSGLLDLREALTNEGVAGW